ncbi:MAG: hypothetical protein U9R56_04420 [candidate division Zixibacteria bacterium]|nr:hypothetical protein [candidate division Zixibacteria bacterium]
MQKKVLETTAGYGLGIAPGHKLWKVPSGQYRGRMVAIVQTSSSQLKLCWADRPYVSWSSPITIASDTADQPFDGVMDGDGNIHIVYSETSTMYLVTRMLTFSGGSWSSGVKHIVYNVNESYYPSLGVESGGKLRVSWSRKTGGFYYLHVKSSTDSGTTWGTGAGDGGDILTGGSSSLYSRLVIGTNEIFAFYTHANDTLSMRSVSISGGSWTTAVILATCSGDFDQDFDAAMSEGGLLGIVFDQEALKYREFDGSSWGPVVSLDETEGICPQLYFNNEVPVIVYLSELASDQIQLVYTSRKSGSFSTPEPLDKSAKLFDSVVLYDNTTSSYADLTSAAASATAADVYHPNSSVLVKQSGDILYLGLDQRFRYIKFLLSTAGSGGTVMYSYWDGSNWTAFTPTGGAFHLDATDHDLLLWQDYASMPEDWQKRSINDNTRFWIKVEVDSVFSTDPVGSRVTAISDLSAVIVRR